MASFIAEDWNTYYSLYYPNMGVIKENPRLLEDITHKYVTW